MNGIELLNKSNYEDNYIFIGNNNLVKKMVTKILGDNYRKMNKLPGTNLFNIPILVSGNEELQKKKFNQVKRNYKYIIKFSNVDMRKSLFRSTPNKNLVNFENINKTFLITAISKKLEITKIKAEKLYDYCNGNIDKIFNELKKLKYLSNEKIIDYINKFVINEDKDIFNFLNSLLKGKKYIDILDRLPDNELKILFMLQKQLKGMIICKSLINKSNKSIADNYELHPYQVKIFKSLCSNISIDNLQELFFKCNKMDRDIKTGRVDSLVGVDKVILEICKTVSRR